MNRVRSNNRDSLCLFLLAILLNIMRNRNLLLGLKSAIKTAKERIESLEKKILITPAAKRTHKPSLFPHPSLFAQLIILRPR